jgi:menaquinone-dependent protoporphyrinogen oxidase
MARILVFYGTTDGHTAKIARSIGDTLRAGGARVEVIEAGTADPDPAEYTAVIVAASVRAGGHQRPVRSWVRTHVEALDSRPTAFVSACLGVLQSDPKVQQEVAATVDRFLRATGWRPGMRKIVAGALLYTRYNWIERWLMRRIVRKAGGDTDTSRDYEYTDWADLHAFVEQFARHVCAPEAAGSDIELAARRRAS